MKKGMLSLLLCGFVFGFAGCAESQGPDNEVRVNRFMSAILQDGALKPGEGTEWGVNENTFVKEVYGSELVDPESDQFEEMRNSTTPDGNKMITPPLLIKFKDIDASDSATANYYFDAEGNFYAINYGYKFKSEQKDDYEALVKDVLEKITKESDALFLEEGAELPDIATFTSENILNVKWFTADNNQILRIFAIEVQGSLLFAISIYNRPYIV